MGGSYGGYATLAGVAFTPDVYAAGVDIVGPSSILTLLGPSRPTGRPSARCSTCAWATSTTPPSLGRMEAQSPLHTAAKIKAPLLVIQGANDPRVKQPESDQIVIALRGTSARWST